MYISVYLLEALRVYEQEKYLYIYKLIICCTHYSHIMLEMCMCLIENMICLRLGCPQSFFTFAVQLHINVFFL